MRLRFLPSLLLGGLLLSGCAVNPVTGKKEVMLVSEGQELAMGKQSDPAIVAQFGLYQDEKLQQYINTMGDKMGRISHRPDLDYQFRIVDSPVINAFAVPGGYVYFTRGIMAHFNNEAQFAGVLGHEIGHVTARHSAKQQTTSIISQVGLMGAMIASPQVARFGEQAMQGLQLLTLKFGRDDENQADELGVEYSTKIGYNAAEMADFFRTLEREQQKAGGEAIPDFLSTHPNPADRYTHVNQLAAEWKAKPGTPAKLDINRDAYLRLIDGITYGEDPRQGFVENNAFYHPELKFEFPIPQGWKSQNSPQQFQMADPAGKAMMLLTLAPGDNLQQAAEAVAKELSLQVSQSRELKVNGFPALAFTGTQVQQDQQTGQQQTGMQVLSYIIQDGQSLYVLIGGSAPQDFAAYAPLFTRTMEGFQRLTSADKLNRQPEHVRIRTVKTSQTLAQALTANGVPAKRHEEMAILNGMQLSDKLGRGLLFKVVGK
ncbi:M48 family metalloprotease [Hymenobacter psychrophilus]|uniref:Putative Zn-dependent protease n=1 Tax=Hymenobacter psychrophilus TaxID=651662 RepID=A0A1H3BEX4_9BACT|nr:M48 family metalloprotease [Hymenobacter psychrophilus]SDX40446.1 Putative Zn-dependent protease [Hymenobacter psychrophilus]